MQPSARPGPWRGKSQIAAFAVEGTVLGSTAIAATSRGRSARSGTAATDGCGAWPLHLLAARWSAPEFWVQPGPRAPSLRFSPIITAHAMIMTICSVQGGPVTVLVARWRIRASGIDLERCA